MKLSTSHNNFNNDKASDDRSQLYNGLLLIEIYAFFLSNLFLIIFQISQNLLQLKSEFKFVGQFPIFKSCFIQRIFSLSVLGQSKLSLSIINKAI